MTKKLLFTLLSVFLSVMTVVGQVTQSVNVSQPGGLSAAIGTNLKTVTDLTLTGTINATDFETIKQMTALQNLNMEKVSVVDNTIPANAFEYRVLNSLVLPNSLKKIAFRTFNSCTISKPLVLPSQLEEIENDAFSYSNINIDFSKAEQSLTTLGISFLYRNRGTSELDLRKFIKLKNICNLNENSQWGTYSGYAGTVILPEYIEDIPASTFVRFEGSLHLSDKIKSIGQFAFESASMKELSLPSSLKKIAFRTFNACTISKPLVLPSQLEEIENDAFANSNINIDFSKAEQSLTTLGVSFLYRNKGTSELDLRKFIKLKNICNLNENSQWGTYSGYAGTVILPEYIEDIPASTFVRFEGSLHLSDKIKSIGQFAFESANMKELSLPSSLKKIAFRTFYNCAISKPLVLPSQLEEIENDAFAYSNINIDFSKAEQSLTTLGVSFLYRNRGTSELDLRKFANLKYFGEQNENLQWGTFSGYNGHVYLPDNLLIIPTASFARFEGKVTLSDKTESIKEYAFNQSYIRSIELPATLKYIGTGGFSNASQLDTIISHNPTPPALGSNVFAGVNKETTVLEISKQSITLYGTADQWKDFLNVNVTIPKELNLLYRIGIGHDSNSNYNIYDQGAIEVNYKAVRIGEYYWMTSNFSHVEPFRKRWGTIRSGDEVDYPMTQEVLNTYLRRMHTDSTQFQVDINEFNNQFGLYYSSYSIQYMNEWGRIFENNAGAENRQWSLPRMADFRQLIGMSPFQKANTTSELSVHDAMYALAAGRSSHPILNYFITDDCGGNWNYWANFGDEGGDIYGFGFTPGGNRLNGPFNQRFMAKGCYDDRVDIEKGSLIQLFHRAQLAGLDGNLSFHEVIDTRQGADYHWLPVRWCRPLTDQELGYKLYINISNIDKNGSQWQTLVGGNEIPLLNYMRNNKIPTDQTSILKLGLKEEVPAGFVELPHGYIRGFYVQYLLDNPTSTLKISDIMEYAYGVQDEALEYVQEQGRPSSKSTTRSISTDDVVIPFRTSSEVRIYPNPVQDVLNVSGEGVEKISLYDLSGRQLQSVSNASSIQMSGLTAGTYIVRVQTASGESVHKVMKK